jgi:hypothetical protein
MGHGLFWKKLCEGKIFLGKPGRKELKYCSDFNHGKDEKAKKEIK